MEKITRIDFKVNSERFGEAAFAAIANTFTSLKDYPIEKIIELLNGNPVPLLLAQQKLMEDYHNELLVSFTNYMPAALEFSEYKSITFITPTSGRRVTINAKDEDLSFRLSDVIDGSVSAFGDILSNLEEKEIRCQEMRVERREFKDEDE